MLKMIVKKTYCPVDKKLVMPHEQKTGEVTKLVCPKCATVLYIKEDWGWRYPKAEIAAAKK
jgi:uncharacterized protein YbaR (Trm112 family)